MKPCWASKKSLWSGTWVAKTSPKWKDQIGRFFAAKTPSKIEADLESRSLINRALATAGARSYRFGRFICRRQSRSKIDVKNDAATRVAREPCFDWFGMDLGTIFRGHGLPKNELKKRSHENEKTAGLLEHALIFSLMFHHCSSNTFRSQPAASSKQVSEEPAACYTMTPIFR